MTLQPRRFDDVRIKLMVIIIMVRNEDAHYYPAADTTTKVQTVNSNSRRSPLRHSLVRRLLLFYTLALLFATSTAAADRR